SRWTGTYTSRFAGNLALLDGADAVCGNQLGAGPDPNNRDRYDRLAQAFADDALVLDTAAPASRTYLAIERRALGDKVDGDVGGRSPAMDVVAPTYTLIIAGPAARKDDGRFRIDDGLASRGDAASTTRPFPYLDGPAPPGGIP